VHDGYRWASAVARVDPNAGAEERSVSCNKTATDRHGAVIF